MPKTRHFALFFLCVFWSQLAITPAAKGDILQHLLAPGEFSPFHNYISGINNCSKCHSIGKGLSSEKCLSCHKKIAARRSRRQGFHGTMQGDCVDCHKEHDKKTIIFNPEKFDHQQAIFHLEGSHQKTECKKCHLKPEKQTGKERFTYLGLETSCHGCHNNPHEPRFSDCQTCHLADNWQRVKFGHNAKSEFKMLGLHKNVGCEKCHLDFQNKEKKELHFTLDTSRQCLSCHKDEHLGQMSRACLSCHNMKGWKSVTFNHDKTNFGLIGPHQKLSCKACHIEPQIKGIPTDCGGCHKKTPHNASHTPCDNCHSQNSWQQLKEGWTKHRDLHKLFRYPLQGGHAKIECQKCHELQPGKFVYFDMAFTDCADCHKDVHQSSLALPCSRCHQLDSFKNLALFDHDKVNFKLEELHKAVPCEKCHLKKQYKKTSASCFRCHLDIARFARGFYKNIGLGLMSPKAKIVDCIGCHETKVANYKVTEVVCGKCHADVYQNYFIQWRQQFHKELAAAASDLSDIKQCDTMNTRPNLKEAEETLLFLKKDFEHNYRFAAAMLKKIRQELSTNRHEYCQD